MAAPPPSAASKVRPREEWPRISASATPRSTPFSMSERSPDLQRGPCSLTRRTWREVGSGSFRAGLRRWHPQACRPISLFPTPRPVIHCAGPSFARGANGGEGGIRTLGRLPYTRFPSVRIRPLCHLSEVCSPRRSTGCRPTKGANKRHRSARVNAEVMRRSGRGNATLPPRKIRPPLAKRRAARPEAFWQITPTHPAPASPCPPPPSSRLRRR